MTMAIFVGLLAAGGVYLIFLGGFIRLIFGFVLLGHAANLVLLSAGVGLYRLPPFIGSGDTSAMADPVPQAFALTAIVITFAVTIYLLGMLARKLHLLREGPGGPSGAYDADFAANTQQGGKRNRPSLSRPTAHNEGGDLV